MSAATMVIVGGGLAGATAAGTLRREGFDGDIRILAAERHQPYLRPPLSKEYLTGKQPREKIFVHTADWYAEHSVDVVVGQAPTAIDPNRHLVTLSDGTAIAYDRLLLATGSTPRHSQAPGADGTGIHYLRTVDDSEALRRSIEKGGKRVVIVGAGWIGLEVASAARIYGNEVTVIGRETIPLQGALGDELGTVFRELHEANGVTFQLPRMIRGFRVELGHVTGVITDRDELLPADVIVIGMGAVPNTALAEAASLEVGNGVLVDEHLASSSPDIFAAGDIANAYHPVIRRRMRNEHWANALGTGKVAGRSMMGLNSVYDEIPYFYTDQFDLGMEYSGYPPLTVGAQVVIRGNKAARRFVSFWVVDGIVVAGMNVNVWDVNKSVQEVIRSGRRVDLARLADPTIELADV